jgi:hypothetical protein
MADRIFFQLVKHPIPSHYLDLRQGLRINSQIWTSAIWLQGFRNNQRELRRALVLQSAVVRFLYLWWRVRLQRRVLDLRSWNRFCDIVWSGPNNSSLPRFLRRKISQLPDQAKVSADMRLGWIFFTLTEADYYESDHRTKTRSNSCIHSLF